MAQAQVVGFAKDYKYLADLLDRMDQRPPHGARRARHGRRSRLRHALELHRRRDRHEGDIKTVGDAIDYSERTIEALRLKAEELGGDPAERAAFEAPRPRRSSRTSRRWCLGPGAARTVWKAARRNPIRRGRAAKC
jgi:type IV secretion system T-DNA border endonuclease VirD2